MNKIVDFYSDKLRDVPSGALILFFEALKEREMEGITVEDVETVPVDNLNSATYINFAAPYKAVKAAGGGGTYIDMKQYSFECHHANDFSCTGSGIHLNKQAEQYIVLNVSHNFYVKNPNDRRVGEAERFTKDRSLAHVFRSFDEAWKHVATPSYAVLDLQSNKQLTGMTK